MKYKYRIDPIAANEYEAAYSWYLEQSPKAAENFIIEIEKTIEAICSDPHRHRKSYKDVREVILKKYPFYLIYLIDEKKKTVLIASIYHNKRDPDKKYIK